MTRTNVIVGTELFMAPEQWKGEASRVGPRTDVYALGLTLWYLLTGGHFPHEGETVEQVMFKRASEPPQSIYKWRRDTPESLNEILCRALALEINGRFPNGKALADALTGFLDQAGDTTLRADVAPPAERAGLSRASAALGGAPAMVGWSIFIGLLLMVAATSMRLTPVGFEVVGFVLVLLGIFGAWLLPQPNSRRARARAPALAVGVAAVCCVAVHLMVGPACAGLALVHLLDRRSQILAGGSGALTAGSWIPALGLGLLGCWSLALVQFSHFRARANHPVAAPAAAAVVACGGLAAGAIAGGVTTVVFSRSDASLAAGLAGLMTAFALVWLPSWLRARAYFWQNPEAQDSYAVAWQARAYRQVLAPPFITEQGSPEAELAGRALLLPMTVSLFSSGALFVGFAMIRGFDQPEHWVGPVIVGLVGSLLFLVIRHHVMGVSSSTQFDWLGGGVGLILGLALPNLLPDVGLVAPLVVSLGTPLLGLALALALALALR